MAWTSPRTWVAGEKPTASTLNTHIRDNLKAIGDARTAYTPSSTNVTLGNGTLTGAYNQAGKQVWFSIKLTLGSTSAITGSVTLGLPVNAVATRSMCVAVAMWDSSASGFKIGVALNQAAGTVTIRDDASTVLSSTSPFTWATGDEIIVSGQYEAA